MENNWIGSLIDSLSPEEVLKICKYHGLDEPDECDENNQQQQEEEAPKEPAVLVREYCEDYASVANCIELAQTFNVDYSIVAELLEGTGGLLTLAALNGIQSLAKERSNNEVSSDEVVNIDIMKLLSKEESRDFIPVPSTGCFVLTDDADSNNGSQYSTQIAVKKFDRSFARIFSGKNFARGLYDIHIRILRTDLEDCPVYELDKKILFYKPNEPNGRKNNLNSFASSLVGGGGNDTSIDVSVLGDRESEDELVAKDSC